jgi:hypothetical protein
MKKLVIWIGGLVGVLVIIVGGIAAYTRLVSNPRIIETVVERPSSEVAERVMLLTFPSGRVIPVNYLREGVRVYVGADGPWWREFRGGNVPVRVLIRGESLPGLATAVLDDPEQTRDVFARLRPTVPGWLPDWLNGVLVVIDVLDP